MRTSGSLLLVVTVQSRGGETVQFHQRLSVALFVSCSVVGCSGYSGPMADLEKTVPAQGVVTYQGEPLENYQVTFYPTDGRRPASGKTSADGRFTLGTNASNDGAPPGTHKVSVVYVGPESTAEPGKEEPGPLPPPKVVVPDKFANPETSEITQTIPASGATDLKIDLTP